MTRKLLASLVCLLFVQQTSLVAQSGAKNGEWRSYAGDTGSTRYSPLDQINASNFNTLEVAWRFKTDSLGPRPEYTYEGTPLFANGVLYATGGSRRAVVALDPATGEQLWMHSEQEGARGSAAPRQLSGRGLAYWTDGREERILYVTPGYRLVALNAKTGANPKSFQNVKGYVRGFDVRTGKRLWIFHTIPQQGEFGVETWEKESWVYTGNTGVWGQISIDEELGLAYLPVEMPTGDYYGGHRPGAGLFGESLVAVDLQTGKRKWHYQLVHHGIWDMDIPCAPILTDITINGRTVKAVAQPTKQGVLYVLNRETGQPIWPIDERPVPQGDVPGEWYSPTQPFPTKPPPYERTGVSIDDVIDFTPALRAEAVELVKKYKMGPMFTPPVVSKLEGPLGLLTRALAGTNWKGGSYDPETHLAYVYSTGAIGTMGLVPPPAGFSDMRYISGNAIAGARLSGGSGSSAGGGRSVAGGGSAAATAAAASEDVGGGLSVKGLPLGKPPYGRITAIDLDKGEIRWQIAHGETPDNIKENPALTGLDIPRTGQGGMAATLVTKTLLISGEPRPTMTSTGRRGAMLRAYDKATGKDAGAVYMPAPEGGAPMTYMSRGKQYIVLAVGGGAYSGELLAFKLPD